MCLRSTDNYCNSVTHCVGAWIETVFRLLPLWGCRVAPSRERGLKSACQVPGDIGQLSFSVGERVEIGISRIVWDDVTPHTGSRIEIYCHLSQRLF